MKKKLSLLLSGLLVLSCLGCSKPVPIAESTVEETIETNSSEELETTEETQETEAETEETQPIPETHLYELFQEHNMKAGTCLTPQMIKNKTLSALIVNQFNSITMENAMKPDYIFNKTESIATGELIVQFNDDVITMLDWAKENGMAVRGHTLVWYSQTPEWIFHEDFDLKKELVGRDVMLKRMESLMKQVFGTLEELGYADLFYAYDVVNEAWMEDGTIRQNNWVTTIDEDYLWYAFYYANQYAPENIDLYYNDYNEQYKADALVNFVNTLVDENGNYLIDGIGLQAHLYTKDNLPGYFKAVDKLSATGLKLQLTELDVSLGAWQNTLEANDVNLRAQGQYYYNLIQGLFERVDAGTLQMDALTFWGFGDSLSWRKEASPLLYDKSFTPKYAYYGAMQMKELAGFDNE